MDSLTAEDEKHLRRSFTLADAGIDAGSRPFGALIVAADGRVVAEGYSTQQAERDWTAHAELNVLRAAGKLLSWDDLAKCTIYASGDPCPMCAGAIYWCNVGRLVFGLDEARMREFRCDNPQGAGLVMSSREVLSRSSRRIEVVGPALVKEAIRPHLRFWRPAHLMKAEGWV